MSRREVLENLKKLCSLFWTITFIALTYDTFRSLTEEQGRRSRAMPSDSEDSDGSTSSLEDLSEDDEFTDERLSSKENSRRALVSDCLRIAEDAAIAEKENRQVVQLEDRLWDSLPPELLEKILTWLPPAAHFRFHCVCKRWRSSLLTSPEWLHHYAEAQPRPACSVVCSDFDYACNFFCHSERKWYKLPLQFPSRRVGSHCDFKLVDADIGLVCYELYEEWDSGRLGLCVSNPLTKSSKLLETPYYPLNWAGAGQSQDFEFVKLHVNRQTRSFKVVILAHSSNPPTTIMYDSTTSRWSACGSYPSRDIIGDSTFVRKNVIYKYDKFEDGLVAFDMDTGLWSDVEVEWPCAWTRYRFIVSHNNRVLLVKNAAAEEPVCVWKLQDETSSFSESSWIKVPVHVPNAIKPLMREVESCVSQGDWVFFYTSFPHRWWLKYTFATNSWRVMPNVISRKKSFDDFNWFGWEPRLDVNVESNPLQEDGSDNEIDILWGM